MRQRDPGAFRGGGNARDSSRKPRTGDAKRVWFRMGRSRAASGCSANHCGAWLAALAIAGLACARPPSPEPAASPRGLTVNVARAPSPDERYCAWYGSRGRDDVLYFGQAAFWWAMAKASGDPTADLRHAGPQLVGRFDL